MRSGRKFFVERSINGGEKMKSWIFIFGALTLVCVIGAVQGELHALIPGGIIGIFTYYLYRSHMNRDKEKR